MIEKHIYASKFCMLKLENEDIFASHSSGNYYQTICS